MAVLARFVESGGPLGALSPGSVYIISHNILSYHILVHHTTLHHVVAHHITLHRLRSQGMCLRLFRFCCSWVRSRFFACCLVLVGGAGDRARLADNEGHREGRDRLGTPVPA